MAIITNYGELEAEILRWADREGDPEFTAVIPSLVKMAETRLFRKLKIQDTEQDVVITEADSPVVPITLPESFRRAKYVTFNDLPLNQISDKRLKELFRLRGVREDWSTADRMYFAIIKRQLFIYPWPTVAPTPWPEFTLEVGFWGTESLVEMAGWNTPLNPNTIPESDGTPASTTVRNPEATTRLLQVAPDVYLWGALTNAGPWLRDDKMLKVWKGFYDEALNELELEDDEANEYPGGAEGVSSVYHD